MLIRITKQRVYFFALIFVITLFSIQKFFYTAPGYLDMMVSYLAYPFINAQGKIYNVIELHKANKRSIQELETKLAEIEQENENLIFENIRLKTSLSHLEQVGELIEFRKKVKISALITAQIIHKQISDQGHFFFIDKGSNEGIFPEMVAVYKNCILGKICDVYPTYSKVTYITDKSCKVAVYCHKTGANGIYEGLNKLDLAELNYVNHLYDIELNDILISSGEGLIFPQGFAVGKISKFQKEQIHYNINIKPMMDITKIKYCQLIKK